MSRPCTQSYPISVPPQIRAAAEPHRPPDGPLAESLAARPGQLQELIDRLEGRLKPVLPATLPCSQDCGRPTRMVPLRDVDDQLEQALIRLGGVIERIDL